MNVVIATDFPVDAAAPKGGVEAVSANLVEGLSNIDGVEVDVVTFNGDVSGAVVEECGSARIHRLPRPGGSLLIASMTAAREKISDFVESMNPDIVHAHDTYGLMTAKLRQPRVFTVHGFIHGDIRVSSTRFRFLKSKVWKYFETRAWSQQPAVISISPYVREKLSRYSRATIFDIDNPISESMFEVERNHAPNRIFSAAVICRRKNTLALVRAVHQISLDVPEVLLVLAGEVTEPSYGHRIDEYIRRHGLQKNIHILGRVSMDRVRDELRKAAIFALVSREENSPMGIEEAMAIGVPIVTSNRCGMPYMVRHGVHGYLTDPEDPAITAKYLARILTNDGLALEFSLAAKDTARRRFHPKVVARLTLAAYQELLDVHWAGNTDGH